MLYNASHNQGENEIDFIDRTYYRKLIDDAYQKISKCPTEFIIIFLHGPGGFGKTSLLENCLKKMKNPKSKPIHISLEITNKDDKIDILIKFRKALPANHFYPLFDYAILFLWNSLNTSQLDDAFLSFTKNSLCRFVKMGTDIGITAALTPAPIAIAVSSITDLMAEVYNKLKKLYGKKMSNYLLEDIKSMPSHELINMLPELLGIDIHKAFLADTLIFVIDSYKQYSKHMIDTSSWLTALVQNIGYGLFVITSRENIVWPAKIKKYVTSKELDKLPEEEVRQELIKKFETHPQLVENIIAVTGCIPIYLDLAVKSLDNDNLDSQVFNQVYFENKEDIVHKFLVHLPEDEQEAITVLAIVQIFNQEIFEFLVKDLHLSVSILSFETIRQRSLIRNAEFDNCFYKTHEVISENISWLTSKNTIQRILKSYITVIRYRGVHNYTNIQISMLFKHIISLIINNSLEPSEEDTEKLFDIYFVIKESLLPFDCDSIPGFSSYPLLNSMYLFLKTLSDERNDSHIRLNLLNEISTSSCKFGKHIKSYELMKGYLQGLCEGSQCLKATVENINQLLSESERQEWYYGQAKIFFGDCKISYGSFKTGISELQTYEQLLPTLIGKENDAFQVTRHIAHGYRFNMFLDEAEKMYRMLIEGEGIIPTPLQKIYILTNLCETCCYFKPNEVLNIYNEAFRLADRFSDLKSKGKIYYSLAIVYLIQRNYQQAQYYINASISFNKQDGYKAGQLYAYMVQAYYEYAKHGKVSFATLTKIENIQKDIEVYGYFSLPLAMMQEKYSLLKQIRKDYEWLNFDKTVLAYRKFLDSIRIHRF